ncbi:hypothetical protein L0337_10625 [candidate division KSB1 bacterium]|nr:hypothetical protein [candidate division KSB1 bacterium]
MSENATSNFVLLSEQPGRDYVKELEEDYKAWKERWENVGRKFLTSGQSPYRDDETRLTHLEKEIEELKRDKSVKDVIIEELLLRISKLEALQNLANRT